MPEANILALPYRPCVGIMLANAEGEIFVGQRLDNLSDAWQMPQGGIDPDEGAQVAALRELEEETGVTADLVTIVAQTSDWLPYDLPHNLVPKFWGGQYRGQKQLWFLMRFNGTDADVNIQTAIPEFNAWQWLPADQVIAKIVPFKRELYQKVVEQFKGYL